MLARKEVLCSSFIDKRIAIEGVRTGKDTSSQKCNQNCSFLHSYLHKNRPCLHTYCIRIGAFALKAQTAPQMQARKDAKKNRPYLHTTYQTPSGPEPEEVSLLREHFSGIASMSADEKALRNATVDMQKAQRFCVLALSASE